MKLTQINNPVALRLDTSVGTRIFAGNTMIYGNTGRRILASWDSDGNILGSMPTGLAPYPGSAGEVSIHRIGDVVETFIRGAVATDRIVTITSLPSGFLADGKSWTLEKVRIGIFTDDKSALLRLGSGHITFSGITAGDRFGDHQYYVTSRWSTTNSWPTILPGLPA